MAKAFLKGLFSFAFLMYWPRISKFSYFSSGVSSSSASKDASLFVYKKTIFEINNDIRKDYIIDTISKKKLDELNKLSTIFNNIIFNLIDNYTLLEIIKITNTEIPPITNKIL